VRFAAEAELRPATKEKNLEPSASCLCDVDAHNDLRIRSLELVGCTARQKTSLLNDATLYF
jgi:hypothetical protein